MRADGSAVTTGRAAGRYFATLLSSLTLLIGFVIAAFDEQKRALHDHVADTRVIRA
ncbi:RDD family protein [compost metagenome]